MQEVKASITLGEQTQDLVEDVVMTVRDAVCSTMGPDGRLAAISVGTSVKVTKDGVTVARGIQFDDRRKELINRIVTEPCIKTDEECGDGTTTTTMLMAEFYSVYSRFNTYHAHSFIDHIGAKLIEELRNRTIRLDVDDPRLYNLALTSSNNDVELARIVTDIYAQRKGRFPSVELKEGITANDIIKPSAGLRMQMELSNVLYSQGGTGQSVTVENFIPVVIDATIGAGDGPIFAQALADLFHKYGIKEETVDGSANPPLTRQVPTGTKIVVIARSIEANMDNVMVAMNHQQKTGFIGCRTGAGGSVGTMIMQDLATILGVPMFSSLDAIKNMDIPVVTQPITIGSNHTTFVPDEATQQRVAKRVAEIQANLDNYEAKERFSRRARMDENRMRDLTGEVVTIWVGGETASDVKERKDRYEDVVKAVKSALVNGILPGVGTSLALAMEAVEREGDWANYPGRPRNYHEILEAILEAARAPWNWLMKKHFEGHTSEPTDPRYPVINLATGQQGTPEELGIYDTAYASITALKGGMQTAKILATLNVSLISTKLAAINLDV